MMTLMSQNDAMPDLVQVDEYADENEDEPHDVPSEEHDASAEDPLRDHSPRSVAETL